MYRVAIFVYGSTTLSIVVNETGVQLKQFQYPNTTVVCTLDSSGSVPVQRGVYMIVSNNPVTVTAGDTDTNVQLAQPTNKDVFPKPPPQPPSGSEAISVNMAALQMAFPQSRSWP